MSESSYGTGGGTHGGRGRPVEGSAAAGPSAPGLDAANGPTSPAYGPRGPRDDQQGPAYGQQGQPYGHQGQPYGHQGQPYGQQPGAGQGYDHGAWQGQPYGQQPGAGQGYDHDAWQGQHQYQQAGPPPGYQPPYPGPAYGAYPYAAYEDPMAKSRLAAGLLGIFLGWLGVHRFYLGHVGIGLLQILVTVVTAGFGGIWGLIEGILYLTARTGAYSVDATGRPLRS